MGKVHITNVGMRAFCGRSIRSGKDRILVGTGRPENHKDICERCVQSFRRHEKTTEKNSENDPIMTVGHGLGYAKSDACWKELKSQFVDIIIDSRTFGPSAAIQRIYGIIRKYMDQKEKR